MLQFLSIDAQKVRRALRENPASYRDTLLSNIQNSPAVQLSNIQNSPVLHFQQRSLLGPYDSVVEQPIAHFSMRDNRETSYH